MGGAFMKYRHQYSQ